MLYQWYCVEDRNKIIWNEYSTGHQTHVTIATDVIIWTWALLTMNLMLCFFFLAIFVFFSWFSKVLSRYFQGISMVFPWFFMVFRGYSFFLDLTTTHFFAMFLRFMDHCMEVILMVANHLSSDAMFVIYSSSLVRTLLEWTDGLLSKKWSWWWVSGVDGVGDSP